ncbi:hypothetical protein [Comamonas testosteroni]|uniref:hypothetical protein n=1 Tax=Comamonas testosteroni TaxID=285 RepID=UPI0005B525F5|nr:hypothetical protein [Comamonas testosteroni]
MYTNNEGIKQATKGKHACINRMNAGVPYLTDQENPMSELAYRLMTQQRALARDRLFLDDALDKRARERHFECARDLASRIIAGNYA